MITVDIIRDRDNDYAGFIFEGHANYSESGKDIVCAAVSALVLNCINSIEALTDDGKLLDITTDEDEGIIKCIFKDKISDRSVLLVESLILGIKGISQSYGDCYLKFM